MSDEESADEDSFDMQAYCEELDENIRGVMPDDWVAKTDTEFQF